MDTNIFKEEEELIGIPGIYIRGNYNLELFKSL
jgi:hypothetical protein